MSFGECTKYGGENLPVNFAFFLGFGPSDSQGSSRLRRCFEEVCLDADRSVSIHGPQFTDHS